MADTRERVEETAYVREVWASNLLHEVPLIMEAARSFPYVAVDTEFPGFLHQTPRSADAHHRYRDIKRNVDAMKLIQLGLSFFGAGGGQRRRRTWQINLRDFDVSSPADAQSEASIKLLRSSGLDLERTRRDGVDSHQLSELLSHGSWVVGGSGGRGRPKWVTFSGVYDVAYLVKLLTGVPLPESLSGFGQLVGRTLGSVFDTKYMAIFCHGLQEGRLGLARLSELLELKVDGGGGGGHHQAGYDSLLTGMAFETMMAKFQLSVDWFEGILCGIELEKIVPQEDADETTEEEIKIVPQEEDAEIAMTPEEEQEEDAEIAMTPEEETTEDEEEEEIEDEEPPTVIAFELRMVTQIGYVFEEMLPPAIYAPLPPFYHRFGFPVPPMSSPPHCWWI